MRAKLENADFSEFKPIRDRLIEDVDNMLATEIGENETRIYDIHVQFHFNGINNGFYLALLLAQIPKEDQLDRNQNVRGGVFDADTGVKPLALHYD